MVAELRAPLNPPIHHSTFIVLRGLREAVDWSPLCRETVCRTAEHTEEFFWIMFIHTKFRLYLHFSMIDLTSNGIPLVVVIAPNSRAHKGGEEKGGVWRILRGGGGKCWLRGNGATQSAICCTMCESGWVGIGHERFGNVGSVLGRHSGTPHPQGVLNRSMSNQSKKCNYNSNFGFIWQESEKNSLVSSAVRETGVSCHHGGPIEGAPETPRASQHYGLEGFKGASWCWEA